jgi:predicted nucleic acid-binding protein
MAELFCDTSGWGHLVDSTQAYHTLATVLYRAARQQNRKIITTNYIVTELVALFTSPLRVPRLTTIGFIESLQTSQIVHIDPTMHRQAWELLARREDKDWSLVDCASLAVMQERKITEALTTDRNFGTSGIHKIIAR